VRPAASDASQDLALNFPWKKEQPQHVGYSGVVREILPAINQLFGDFHETEIAHNHIDPRCHGSS
jgi:hypothetical protein